jgi:hypothetical protein
MAGPKPAPVSEPAPAVPDYLASPNAVFGDEGVQWRYGRAPDYSKTRKVWEEGKSPNPRVLGVPNSTCNVLDAWLSCVTTCIPPAMWAKVMHPARDHAGTMRSCKLTLSNRQEDEPCSR